MGNWCNRPVSWRYKRQHGDDRNEKPGCNPTKLPEARKRLSFNHSREALHLNNCVLLGGRLVKRFWLATVLALPLALPSIAQSSDDSLRIYAVNVVKTLPFQTQFTGYGIYLGQGIVITAAHVVGRWPGITRPRVLVAGQDLPAHIIKQGSYETIDLALLSVDQGQLPINLLLRRNPLCAEPSRPGEDVVDVIPEGTTHTHIISPILIPFELRKKFRTLITTPQRSGSGIFDANSKCLVGIMSAKVSKRRYVMSHGHLMAIADGYAGFFVPAATIASFIPPEFQFLLPQPSGFRLTAPP
jgi:hypothetical protein